MKKSDVIEIVTRVCAIHGSEVSAARVEAWNALLGDLDFNDSAEAINRHYRQTRDWIMPADIRTIVRSIANDRIDRRGAERHALEVVGVPMPNYVREMLAQLKQKWSANTPKDQVNPDLHKQALKNTCAYCGARPHQQCTNLAANGPLNAGYHPSRLETPAATQPQPATQESPEQSHKAA